ncbi:MAG TPA: NAD(+) synthase [Oscillospiraceae bacterium]|nr:NAD(+) synthase [Oscillospiraceae bacterium]HPS34336.1 NAD(+) synthase [Oscillospiraceae bacterium]
MFDFIRAASAVPNVGVGDVEYNLSQILNKAKQAQEAKADLLVFPELCISGYTCADLFFQKTLLDEANKALIKLLEASRSWDFITVVGMPVTVQNQLYNCAIVINHGRIEGIVPKTFMPNYSEFYERRWFSTSCDLKEKVLSSSLFGISEIYDIPIGRGLVFNLNNRLRIGVEICEDLWVPIPPSTFLALGGAELIVNISCSNEIIAKREYRRDLVKQQSGRTLCGYVYCSAGGTESTTDLIYSGHSLIAENGALLRENEQLIDTDYLLVSDIDLGRIRADRMKNKSFKDSVDLYGVSEPVRTIDITDSKSDFHGDGTLYPLRKLPFVPPTQKDRLERCLNIFRMQVAGLKKRLEHTKGKAVVGVSGGLDSTLALLVSAEVMRELKRPLTDVIGITMPCFGTSDRTYQNSLELMKTLGVTSKEIDIKQACELHYQSIGHDINKHDLTFENTQARERTQVLMDYAGEVGGLVVGTGDLSELALGWCTYNADHMSMYNVNGSIPKTLIRWMIDGIIQYNIFEKSTEVLRDILDTPISPELLPPNADGKIAQQTEDIVGPYALHDFFLYYVMRFGFEPEKIFYLAALAFRGEFDNKTILKWLRVFYTRFFAQQYKRSCLPDGVKVGSVSLSPRGDWRMPSDASAASWLKRITALEKQIQ